MNNNNRKSLFFPYHDSKIQNFIWIISVAIIYFVAAQLSLLLIIEPEGIAAIWPPSGIFLSAILLTRRNLRPYLIGTLFITDLIAEMIAGSSIPISLIYAFSVTCDAAFSAFLLNRFLRERIMFNKVKHVFGFILLSVLFSNAIFSLVAAAAPKIYLGASLWHSWIMWFASNGIGNLLITPFILSLVYLTQSDWVKWNVKKILEGTAIVVFTLFVFPLILNLEIGFPYFIIIIYYLIFIMLFWAVWRFGIIGTSIEILILTSIILYNIFTKNIVVANISVLDLVLLVQLSLALIVISSFVLSAFLSELKDAENTSKISEQKFRSFFENSMDAILVSSPSGEIESANKAACKMFERTEDEICKIGREGLIDLTDPRVKMLLQERAEKGSVFGELNMLKKDGTLFPVEISSQLFKDNEGKDLLSIIIRDISDRRQAEKELLRSERILRLFIENSPASIAMFDKEMNYIIASKRYLHDYNLRDQNVVGRSHYEIFPEIPERWKNIHKRCMEGATERSEADPFPRADGTLDWVRWEIIPWHNSENEIGGIILMSEVITEKKRSLDLLRESENYTRTLFDNSIIGLAVTELDGKLIDINQAYADLIGRTIEETKKLTYWDITPEKYFGVENEQLNLLQTIGKYGPYEKEYIHKDGHLVPVRLQGLMIERNSKKFIWSSVENITDRVNDEKLLRQNEQRLSSIYDTVGDVLTYLEVEDIDKYRFKSVNNSFYKITGLSEEMVIGKLISEIIPEPSLSYVLNKYREAIETKSIIRWEETTNYPTGKLFGEVSIAPVFDNNGNCTHLVGSVHDLTERQQAIEKLRLQAQVMEQVREAIIATDLNGFLVEWNNGAARIFNYSEEDILGKPISIIFPKEQLQIFTNEIQPKVKEHGWYQGEITLKRKSGDEFPVQLSLATLLNSKGDVVGMTGTAIDISERKLAEQEKKQSEIKIKLSEKRYRTLFEYAPDGILIADNQSFYLDANSAMCSMLGYARDEIIGMHGKDIVVPTEVINIEPALGHISSGKDYSREWTFRRKDGSIFSAEVIVTTLPDGNLLAMVRDITERKRAEEVIHGYEYIVSASLDMMSLLDDNYKYLAVNKSYLKAFKFTTEQIIGRTVSDVFGKEFFEKTIKPNGDRCLNGENINYKDWFNFPAYPEKFMDINYYPFYGKNQKISGFVVNGRDITEQKRTDQKLEEMNNRLRELFANLDNMREEERKTVARELHDELGQVITSIKMNLSLLQNSVQKDKYDKEYIVSEINEMQHIIDISKDNIKDLIRYLRPEFLDNLGIIVALNHIIDQTIKNSGVEIEFNHNVENIVLKPEVENTIFRVIQEGITNIIKHSKATKIKINLLLNSNILNVSISDNGVGIKISDLKKKNSLGIVGIQERLKIIGSKLDLDVRNGTTLKFSLII